MPNYSYFNILCLSDTDQQTPAFSERANEWLPGVAHGQSAIGAPFYKYRSVFNVLVFI